MSTPVTYLCRGDRKNTRIAFFVFLGIFALGILCLSFELTTPMIGQVMAFLSVIIAVYIYVRYIATAFRYEIRTEDGEAFFCAVRIQGKKALMLFARPLSELSEIIEVESGATAHAPRPKLATYNYSAHLLADSYFLLHFEGDDPVFVRINTDEEFLAHIAAHLPAPAAEPAPPAEAEAEAEAPAEHADNE